MKRKTRIDTVIDRTPAFVPVTARSLRRPLWIRLLALVMVLLAAPWARAATVEVYAFNTRFSTNQPGEPIGQATIYAGDSIRFVWLQGNHTTTAVVGSTEQWNAPLSSSSTSFTRVFSTPGVYWFYCLPHGFDNGDGTSGGMSGYITVLPAGTGACCHLDGSCEILTEAACVASAGVFQGLGTTCDAGTCGADPITVTLVASADNILYETLDGSISNALGRYLYVGNQSSGARRRSVLRFDTSAIPTGVAVTAAQFSAFCSNSSGAPTAVTLHRLLASWGEGTSVAGGNEGNGAASTIGDATWIHRFYANSVWAIAGGDFVSTPTSSSTIASTGTFLWKGNGLIADVQAWLDAPASNHGWILRGDEASSSNTKRFDSRQSTTAANRPSLTITYLPAPPTGACCLDNGTCIEVAEDVCEAMLGTYRGDGTDCDGQSCPVVLQKFVDPLPRPAVAQPATGSPGGAAHYEIAMTEQFQRFHRDLPETRVWGYGGSYPGPTIEARSGEPVTVVWRNQLRVWETGQLRTTHVLPVDTCLHGPDQTGEVPVTVVHLHGGKVASDSDGFPDDAFPPGQQSHVYTYPNQQPAATIWYHDHALGITRLNVMMGLAGFYLIRDEVEESLGLPSGAYEVPLAIQDRSFNPDGSLRYQEMWHDHFFGDTIVVNGKAWPYLDVARGKYRFRLLNGSTSRTYALSLSDGATFWQIGTDMGLRSAPLALQSLTLLPGERADVVVDFAGYAPGTRIELRNSAPAPFPGFPGVGVVPEVMEFRVGSGAGHLAALPASLVAIPPIPPSEAVTDRVLDLMLGADLRCPEHKEGMWMIDGRDWDEITEYPVQGTTEIWTWRNDSGVSHPMHIHLVSCQVLWRQAIDPTTGLPTGPLLEPAPSERGWKDTVDAVPGFYTSVIARFDGEPGFYPYHCHILEHEDHEMMRQFELLADCDGNGVGDRIEIDQGLAADCNGNGELDSCEIAGGAADCNANGALDSCEIAGGAADCNANGQLDSCEIAGGATDCNANGQLDSCELAGGTADCNANGVLDSCEIAGGAADCNANGLLDSCEIAGGAADTDADGRIDACERAWGDLDLDGIVAAPDLALLLGLWGDPAPPFGDLNGDGVVSAADLAILLSRWGPIAG